MSEDIHHDVNYRPMSEDINDNVNYRPMSENINDDVKYRPMQWEFNNRPLYQRYGESLLAFSPSFNKNLVKVSIFLTLKMSTSPLTESVTGTDVSCRLQTMTMSAHAQSVIMRSLARRFHTTQFDLLHLFHLKFTRVI